MSDDTPREVIFRSVVDARQAVKEWELSRKFEAEGLDDYNVSAARLRAEYSVFCLIEHLQPYLVSELPRMWEGYDDPEEWIYFDAEEEFGVPGLRAVMTYSGSISESDETVKRHDGYHNETTSQADMLPEPAVSDSLKWCSQAAFELGFLPEPQSRRKSVNVSREATQAAEAEAEADTTETPDIEEVPSLDD